jgi:hypothetical protein
VYYVLRDFPAQTMFRILDAAIQELHASEATPTSQFVYELDKVFNELQRRADVPKTEIARREYAYLPLFGYHDRKLILHEVMAEDPGFYVSLICDAFKPQSGEPREPTDEAKARANAAYRLLGEFRTVPGVSGSQVDPQFLRDWVNNVRRLGNEADRSAITDEFIGHVLAHAPADADGAWPHRTVRNLIEEIESDHAELGITIEHFNSRGVQTRAMYEGGGRERALAEQARQWAKAARGWPRTSSMLNDIAKSWDRHAEDEDERARHDEMRFEGC